MITFIIETFYRNNSQPSRYTILCLLYSSSCLSFARENFQSLSTNHLILGIRQNAGRQISSSSNPFGFVISFSSQIISNHLCVFT